MNIALIGYRGTGKTTVARLLAARLGWSWRDADVELERAAGISIAEMFSTRGESAFRDLETVVLRSLLETSRQVLALGGGVVLREANQTLLRTLPVVVWLQAPPETLWARIEADISTAGRRPNLTATGGQAEIERLLAVRLPLYAACSTHVVNTEGKSPAAVADEIQRLLAPLQLTEGSA